MLHYETKKIITPQKDINIRRCSTKTPREGWNRRRHEHIPKSTAEAISAGVEWEKSSWPSEQAIAFIKVEQQPKPTKGTSWPLQGTGSCWWTLNGSWSYPTILQPPCNKILSLCLSASGADSPMGRSRTRGLWKEALQVRWTGQQMSAGWMESEGSPSRGWMQGLCCQFCSLCHSVIWSSKDRERGEPSVIPLMQQREPQDGCSSKEESHGVIRR